MPIRRRRSALLAVLLPLALAGLALAHPGAAQAKVIWLCRPGHSPDPCTPGLATTRFSPTGRREGVDHVRATRHPKIDCFYVYPTVSDQKTVVANRHIDAVQRSIALYQAARYSRDCRVFAPMYRQLTLKGISGRVKTTAKDVNEGYDDVRTAFRRYLARDNHGRGFVLVGHSQGSFVLKRLVAAEVDRKPAVRRRMLSAILLGGNVEVADGRDTGGDFRHVHACHRRAQLHCVIAFSTFDAQPPANAVFGRTSAKGRHILCTNPAALGGGSGPVTPIYPTAPFAPGSLFYAILNLHAPMPAAPTPWRSSPRAYTARCSGAGGAHVLRIFPRGGAPVLNPSPDAAWGLHLVDANIALQQLTDIVRAEGRRFVRRHARASQ